MKGSAQTHTHSSMEPLVSVGGYGVIVGEQKVIVDETADLSPDNIVVL